MATSLAFLAALTLAVPDQGLTWAGNSYQEVKPAPGDGYRDAPPGDAIACLGMMRLRYPRWATSLAYSPKGDIIAVGCGTQILRWDAATGKPLPPLLIRR